MNFQSQSLLKKICLRSVNRLGSISMVERVWVLRLVVGVVGPSSDSVVEGRLLVQVTVDTLWWSDESWRQFKS